MSDYNDEDSSNITRYNDEEKRNSEEETPQEKSEPNEAGGSDNESNASETKNRTRRMRRSRRQQHHDNEVNSADEDDSSKHLTGRTSPLDKTEEQSEPAQQDEVAKEKKMKKNLLEKYAKYVTDDSEEPVKKDENKPKVLKKQKSSPFVKTGSKSSGKLKNSELDESLVVNGDHNNNEPEVFKDANDSTPAGTEHKKKSPKSVTVRGKSLDEERENDDADNVTDQELNDSLDQLASTPDIRKTNHSSLIDSLMETYLDTNHVNRSPTLQKPSSRGSSRKASTGDEESVNRKELEENLKNSQTKSKKQPPPPVRNKPPPGSRTWEDPPEGRRQRLRKKSWPPKEPPKDVGAYVVESYGQTDPYTKRLIKDIQRAKREEEERKRAEKRAEIVSENTKPVSTLRDTFSTKPPKPRPGTLRPESNISGERSWIRHEKKPVEYDDAPEEPDWMKLIRNRRWKSTVKARFPCKTTDRTEFERRSTTPKNWKKLAKDKNALKMLSEIVGIGAEGEELFMRLASQRQKIDEEREHMDKLAHQELLAYQVARETLGEDAAYSLQMDNPLPAARMRQLNSVSTMRGGGGSLSGSNESLNTISATDASSAYPFTTSQLEAAYLSNQLLRLHPEEFRKLISLERSRQATLRWQFSADPFDSVHDHQSLPYEMAILASEEPRVLQAMRKIVAQGGDEYRSVFSSTAPTPQPRYRARSEGGFHNYYGQYESDGYESSNSVSSSSSVGVAVRGRPKKKKKPVPLPPRARGRSCSPSMMTRHKKLSLSSDYNTGSILKEPSNTRKYVDDENREVQSHSLFDDADVTLGDEIASIDQLTTNITRDINQELAGIEASLEDRKRGFFEEANRNERSVQGGRRASEDIDTNEIASRRKSFVDKDLKSSATTDVRADLPKTRHKVRRINSNAQLNAVFRKRREISDVEDQGNTADKDPSTTKEMSDVLQDINNTYGDSNK